MNMVPTFPDWQNSRTFPVCFPIFTARKRSLGQGNVFTLVCHSVHGGEVGFPACITGHTTKGGLHPGGLGRPFRDTWDTTGYGQQAGGMHPTWKLSSSSIFLMISFFNWKLYPFQQIILWKSLKIISKICLKFPDVSSVLCDFPRLFQSVQNTLTGKCLPIFPGFPVRVGTRRNVFCESHLFCSDMAYFITIASFSFLVSSYILVICVIK